MALFTAAAVAAALGLAAEGFAAAAITFGLNAVVGVAASMGLSYAAKALAGDPNQTAANDNFSVQGQIQAAGDVPRSFNFGYSVTAGSRVYMNTWGDPTDAPNAYVTEAIALSDLPGGSIAEIWINDERCTLGAVTNALLGAPVLEYRRDDVDHLWIRYHDGFQTAADELLVSRASSADRPYEATRIGVGIAYAVCTAYVNDKLFTGYPAYKFALTGVSLYDPSRDSTVGGSGSHRWSDRSTWGGDGDNLPAVQIYNILRGITFNGSWLYGLQRMTASRLPIENWLTQISKCRDGMMGEAGLEPTYRSGGQINVNAQIANTIEALLTACQGKISEIGGSYKIHLGVPDGWSNGFTDAEILSSEEQSFTPFFGLANSINGITATYPSPAEAWNTKTAPPYYRPDLEEEDGDRRLLASPSFDFVPYDAQVQRLMKSALEEARRARQHTISLGPDYWDIEPGDVVEWSSVRNGYSNKLFRVDGVVDRYNLDVILSLTEVDPSDYDWDHNVDFQGVSTGPTSFVRPEPQGVRDWYAEGTSINDPNGIARRPAIRLAWDGSVAGVIGIQYEVRLAADNSSVTRGRSDQLEAGALLISQSILPNTTYGVRGQYIPSAPRDMLWSDWLSVTTPDVRLGLDDFSNGLRDFVTEEFRRGDAIVRDMVDFIAAIVADLDAGNRIERKKQREVIEYREAALNNTITGVAQEMSASIEEVSTIASSTSSILASYQITVNAQLGSLSATTTTNATSVASLNSAFSTYTVTNNAAVNGLSASVTQTSTAVATINGQLGASWGVQLNVNNLISGIRLVNGGATSAFVIQSDLFQVAFPGVQGATPIFQIANVNGSARLAFRGDFFADGSIFARNMTAGSITAANGAIDALAVKSLNIGDNAVVVPVVQNGFPFTGNNNYQQANELIINVDTTGLAGKPYTIYALFNSGISYTIATAVQNGILYFDGVQMQAVGNNAPTPELTMSAAKTYTASGGLESHRITVNWYGDPSVVMGTRSLCVWAVKR